MTDERSLQTLEYEKVLELLAARAASASGRERCLALRPVPDLAEATALQEETDDHLRLILKDGDLPLSAFDDLRASVARMVSGAVPGPLVFLQLARLLRLVQRVAQRLPSDLPPEEWTRSTVARIRCLEPLDALRRRVEECILGEDEISDRASPELYRIRRAIQKAQDDVKTQLDKILRHSGAALQEQLVTIRQNRYVLPVKSEQRGLVPGIVHDSSSSGATVFVEPLVVVELNNRIRELQSQERDEIERILAELAALTAEKQRELLLNHEMLTQLDFTQAKARLARQQKAFAPVLNDRGILRLRKARHPLIPADQVVPIDFELGVNFRTLVITGPNTGGKTVSLKTCGLFAVMAMSGLQIPAAEYSEISIFNKVLADIGDEQSIEQSLSTFSSHITQIIRILRQADERSLVLLDELGAGTDPTEGAALAIAILDELRRRGSSVVATTHYQELKGYALNTENVSNACCEFDTLSLRPTYRLLIGVPGVSNALAISTRLGLPEDIIRAARDLIADEGARFEELVEAIERSHRQAEEMKNEIAALRDESAALRQKLKEEQKALEEKKRQVVLQAQCEARQILHEAEALVEQELKQMREEGGGSERAARSARSSLRERSELLDRSIGRERLRASIDRPLRAEDIEAGQYYLAALAGFSGQAQSGCDSKGQVTLRNGSLSLTVPYLGLRRLSEDEVEKLNHSPGKNGKNRLPQMPSRSSMTLPSELQLLGFSVEEALAAMDRYVDDAQMAGLHSLRIVHGKGSGALRKAVRQALKKDPRVTSFREAGFGEGDAGVTIAELR